MQLYLDEFKDLLLEEPRELKLVDGKDGSVHLQNLTSHKATSAEDVLRALAVGATRRATRGHDMNAVSSRSHAILMLRLVKPGGSPSAPAASMFIVDLAGSERVARSGVTGQGFDEATSINQSLTGLGRVVVTLIESGSSKGFVPYNAHPLTMILKPGLGGNSRTCLIACVTQAPDSMNESVNTLRFAMQVCKVYVPRPFVCICVNHEQSSKSCQRCFFMVRVRVRTCLCVCVYVCVSNATITTTTTTTTITTATTRRTAAAPITLEESRNMQC